MFELLCAFGHSKQTLEKLSSLAIRTAKLWRYRNRTHQQMNRQKCISLTVFLGKIRLRWEILSIVFWYRLPWLPIEWHESCGLLDTTRPPVKSHANSFSQLSFYVLFLIVIIRKHSGWRYYKIIRSKIWDKIFWFLWREEID